MSTSSKNDLTRILVKTSDNTLFLVIVEEDKISNLELACSFVEKTGVKNVTSSWYAFNTESVAKRSLKKYLAGEFTTLTTKSL